MFTIKNNRVLEAAWMPTPNIGGRIEPQLIVLHETAGHLDYGNSARWLCNPKAQASAHFTVERDGRLIQLAACDVATWHSGRSSWHGRCDGKGTCNSFSIGIEIVGPGRLTKRDSKTLVASFGKTFPIDEGAVVESQAHGGRQWWLRFTDAQVATVEALVRALRAAYPTVTDVLGHYEIAPGRKVDPAPTFPIARIKALLADREAPDRGLVESVQRRLLELSYDAGDVDGYIGQKFRAAVFAFQQQNHIPATGDLDDATHAALASPGAVAMTTGTRAETTKTDVASAETVVVKRGAELNIAVEAVNASTSLQKALGEATKAKGAGDQLTTVIGWATSPTGIRSLSVFAFCAFAWWAANKIDWTRVRARIRG